MESIIDYSNPNVMYTASFYGEIRKNNGSGWSMLVQSNGANGTINEKGSWVTLYIMHPTNPNILLVGKTQVYQINGSLGLSLIILMELQVSS